MLKRELVVVTDQRVRSTLPDRISNIPVRMIDWHDIDALASANDSAVLVDVDLQDVAKIKFIKDRLPYTPGRHCRIVAVDRGSHQAETQANGLGASAVLKRPLDISSLKALLLRYFPYDKVETDFYSAAVQEALEETPGGASIMSAAYALNGMFAALTSDRPLDLKKITQAGDQVVDAIADVGLAKWLDIVRQHHESTFQHCLIVTGVTTAFGQKNGMRRSDILTLTVTALLHDIGKVQVPLKILDKPASLTRDEFAIIKRHPAIGYDYLCTQDDMSADIIDAVRHHHEYLDGSGYPDGLHGRQIEDLTRIVTLCDAYGALVERRPYRESNSPSAALDIVTDMSQSGKIEHGLVRALTHSVAE
jgi:HD-GYP domain-containing protein (c-di-GMP phosphodiesterase class II)